MNRCCHICLWALMELHARGRCFDRFEPLQLIDMRTPFAKCENNPCKQITKPRNWMALAKPNSRHVRFIIAHSHWGVPKYQSICDDPQQGERTNKRKKYCEMKVRKNANHENLARFCTRCVLARIQHQCWHLMCVLLFRSWCVLAYGKTLQIKFSSFHLMYAVLSLARFTFSYSDEIRKHTSCSQQIQHLLAA